MNEMLCIGLYVLVFGLSLIAEKYKKIKYVFLLAFVLSLICGLRNITVGIDTPNYYRLLTNTQIVGINYGSDIGFSTISYFLMKILKKPEYVLLIYSFITNYLIIFRFWDFRKEASFLTMSLMYVSFFYFFCFNIVRQCLAIALVFWGTRYLDKKKHYAIYVFFNILGTLMHTSAIIGFIFLLQTQHKRIKKIYIKIFIIGVCLIGSFIFKKNINKYFMYLKYVHFNIHTMVIFKILCFIFIKKIVPGNKYSVIRNKCRYLNENIVKNYQIGLLLSILGMFFLFLNRLSFYFMMYEMPFWGQLFSIKNIKYKKNKRYICKILFVFIIAYSIFISIYTDKNILLNYKTFL